MINMLRNQSYIIDQHVLFILAMNGHQVASIIHAPGISICPAKSCVGSSTEVVAVVAFKNPILGSRAGSIYRKTELKGIEDTPHLKN